MRCKSLLLLVLLSSLIGASGHIVAHSYRLEHIAIGHAWAPPTTESAGAIYVPLLNLGDSPDRIVGASTPIAHAVRIHFNKRAETTWLDALKLPPGKPIALAAWQEHLWMVGLKRPLATGDRFELTLQFARSGSIRIEVHVE